MKTSTTTYKSIAYPTILLFLMNLSAYAFLFYCYSNGILNGWICGILGGLPTYGMFTVIHEACHGNISCGVKGKLWMDSFFGWTGSFFFLFPYSAFVIIHLKHHAHTNDPEKDPDGFVKGDGFMSTFLRCNALVGHYYKEALGKKSKSDNAMQHTRRDSFIFLGIQFFVLTLIWLNGYIIPYFFVIILPIFFAAPFLAFSFDWLPHFPHNNMGTYHNTRVVTVKGLEWLSLFQSYHLIHHLYPRIPWYKYKQKFKAIESDLRGKGSPIEGLNIEDGKILNPDNTYTDLIAGDSWKYALKIDKINPLTHDSISIRFKNIAGIPFKFKSGQYLVLSRFMNDRKVSRCYSISSAPKSGELEVGIKRVNNGLLSNHLADNLRVGEKISVAGPYGNFNLKDDANLSHVFIAGGSGITPLLSMIQDGLNRGWKNLHLFYGCRSEKDIMYKDALKNIQEKFGNQFEMNITFDLMTEEKQTSFLQKFKNNSAFYICGPQPMMDASKNALNTLNISENIFLEEFSPADTKLSGETHQIKSNIAKNYEAYSSETILDAALRQDLALPYACGMGQCGTCKVKLESGKVNWKEENQTAMLQSEIEEGYILTCMCKAASDELSIKY